jgi:GDP-L-fucose synthase
MSHFDLSGRSIFVTGHNGMVGGAIMRLLQQRRDVIVLTAERNDLDLTDKNAVYDWMAQRRPEVIIHAAGRVGGIAPNEKYPVEFLNDNLSMAQNVINGAYEHKVRKLVFMGSSCIYPKDAPQPLQPESLLTSSLEPSNEAYALAKIVGTRLCSYYRREYGMDYISLMPCNLYGEGDHYDGFSSHVIPALILKLHNAKSFEQPQVKLWGSGRALREFLYVDDLAEGALCALEGYSDEKPLNIGSGTEVTIRDLATFIAQEVGYKGEILFDHEQGDGTPRKVLDSQVMDYLGWRAKTTLVEGLSRSYADFLKRDIEQKM